MSLREAVERLVNAAPPGSLIPRDWLAEQLATDDVACTPADAPVVADLTVQQVATLFGKGTSTVRAWLAKKELPGAYQRHGEWRIPPAAIEAMQRAAAANPPKAKESADASSGTTDLGAWRKHVRPSSPKTA